MFTKTVIAHELGHVVSAFVADSKWVPDYVHFLKPAPGVLSLAEADFTDLEDKHHRICSPSLNRILHVSDLGGMFGELIYGGQFSPWGIRGDIENWLTANSKSKASAVPEMDDWYYRAVDPISYHYTSAKFGLRERRKSQVHTMAFALRCPEMFKLFTEFCAHIDVYEFNEAVEELYFGGDRKIEQHELFTIACRIVYDMFIEDKSQWLKPYEEPEYEYEEENGEVQSISESGEDRLEDVSESGGSYESARSTAEAEDVCTDRSSDSVLW